MVVKCLFEDLGLIDRSMRVPSSQYCSLYTRGLLSDQPLIVYIGTVSVIIIIIHRLISIAPLQVKITILGRCTIQKRSDK